MYRTKAVFVAEWPHHGSPISLGAIRNVAAVLAPDGVRPRLRRSQRCAPRRFPPANRPPVWDLTGVIGMKAIRAADSAWWRGIDDPSRDHEHRACHGGSVGQAERRPYT
jgi:hypothetical protein